MTLEIVDFVKSFVEGIMIGFMASMPLGPIGVLCIQRTLYRGRRSGFASGLGAATSDFIYALIAGFSVSLIVEFIADHRAVLTWVGAIILIFLGLKIYFTNPVKQMRKQQKKRSGGLWSDYVSTFALTFTNPLAIFLFLSLFSIFGGQKSFLQQVVTIGGVGVGASLWWLTLVILVGLFRKNLTIKRLYYLNKIAGSVIVVLVIIGLLYEPVVDFIKWLFS
ncbi:MAG: LysE family transporter [Marinilabiliaceae bacterium]|nr:LysE family transporter [Marinilabiliaceae bacterium]